MDSFKKEIDTSVHKIDKIIKELKVIKHNFIKEKIKVSLDRDNLKKRYIQNNISFVKEKTRSDKFEVLFGTDDSFTVGNYEFYTEEKKTNANVNKFYFSFYLPNIEKYWDVISNYSPTKWYNLPDDTELRVYTTSKLYIIFQKKEFTNFKYHPWRICNNVDSLLVPHFELKLKLIRQIKETGYVSDKGHWSCDSDDSDSEDSDSDDYVCICGRCN